MARRNKKRTNYINLVIIFVIVLIILAMLARNRNRQAEDNVAVIERPAEEIEDVEDRHIKEQLQTMEERDRMEYYFSMFLGYLEAGEYEKAYEVLYPEFKKNYFPDIDSFTEYAKETFTEMTSIQHENIERVGDVYVLWIEVADAINGKPGEETEMNVVLQEYDYGEFVISFSVI